MTGPAVLAAGASASLLVVAAAVAVAIVTQRARLGSIQSRWVSVTFTNHADAPDGPGPLREVEPKSTAGRPARSRFTGQALQA